MMIMPTMRRLGIALVFVLAMSSARAADVNGRIRGTVTDPTGAVVVKAMVVATNTATGVKFDTTSQADGGYLFAQLPIGTYSITVTAPGFSTFSATGIVLNIDQAYIEPVQLSLGNASAIVEVKADTAQVNTTDMQLSNIVDSTQMEELPLIGRNFTGLEVTLPGVQPTDTRFSGTYSVSGAQAQQSEYLINGADTNDIALNTIVFTPNLDAIDQFNLLDGPLNAEYDRNSGGIVSATIKQGTNQFHGDAFEFYRDTFLNTQNFLQKTYSNGALTSTVSPFHQNIFGGTVGGPVLRDKLHFFAAYQGIRERIPQSASTVNVYNSAMLGGNFSADIAGTGPNGATTFSTNPIPATITIPGCAAGSTWATCLGLKGGIVPAASLNSTAVAIARQYTPTANSGTYGYGFNATTKESDDQYIGRVDYNLDSKNQITALGLYEKFVDTETLPFSGANIPGFGDGNIEHIQQWTGDYVRQISSSAVNDFAVHYTRFNYDADVPQQVVQPSSAGFSITPQDSVGATLPYMNIAGYFSLGGNTSGPQPRIDQVIQAGDTVSKVIGSHSLKFGYDGRRFNVSNAFDASNSGNYNYQGGGTYSTGDPGLDFLLGIPDTYLQTPNGVIQADAFLNYIFAQDTWKLTNSFTLDVGLGYSIDTPLRNHQYAGEGVSCFIVGQQSTVFPSAPKNMDFPGDPGCTDAAQAYTRHNELGPRIGFAWAPDLGRISGAQGKFSVRGGFGIYYNRSEEESALQTLNMPPFGFTSGGAADFAGSPQFVNPFADINNGLTTTGGTKSEPNRFPYTFPVKGQSPPFPATIFNISSFDSSFRAPYSENFQLSIERELPGKIIARIGYVGSLGRHEQITPEGNYETAAGHAACVANPACSGAGRNTQALGFPQNTVGGSSVIVEEGEVASGGSSNYSSLQTSLTKGMSHGLQFQVSYTYAHALDNGSSFENSGFGGFGVLPGGVGAQRGYNQYVKSLNYGDSTYDVRHHFVFSPVYTVPLLHGQSPLSPLNLALSGWQISGILQLSSGEPYDIAYNFGTSRSLYCSVSLSFYNCPDIPNQTAPLVKQNPRMRNASGHSPYFSPGSFAAETTGSFGNIHRNPYHGAGINNTNLILAKNFTLSSDGTLRLQLRLESDNVFNHTQFNLPDGNFADGTFGQITSARNARQTQLGAKIYF